MRALILLAVIGLGLLFVTPVTNTKSYPDLYNRKADIRLITQAQNVQAVKHYCDLTHNEVNAQSENVCGQAQAVTGTEYLCQSTKPNSFCWVEFTN